MAGNLEKAEIQNPPDDGSEAEIECIRCGLCCVDFQAILTDEDIDTLAKNLALTRDRFISEYVQATIVGYLIRHTRDGCIFLRWHNNRARATCTVHPFRPECCRAWKPGLFQKQCLEGQARLQSEGKLVNIEENPVRGRTRGDG